MAYRNKGIMHENCITGKSYIVDIKGKRFEACFRGYPDGDQYNPVFEIRDHSGSVKVLKEYEIV
ncbi:MAG: hypothetical protein NTZ78_08235 [Candidatus Aureabacteria bacterium]|nr:hypothetical protein [Candidatus Auribacterota bacterium]